MDQFTLRRVVRAINMAVAILLVGGAGAAYWFVWRPLPQRSGTAIAPVSAEVWAVYDRQGTPHIRAGSLDDALFAQGYVTAQDRLFQMDGLRRLAAGDLAEVFGPGFVENDREARRFRFRRIAEEAYVTLPPGDRAAFAAYARGVNFYIATHLHSLPLEFTLLGYQPRPWSAVDSLLICLHMFRTLTTSWRDEIAKRDMLADGDARKVEYLWAVRAGTEPQPGSNAWALSGRHTASGKPLLSNDMHLEYSLPGTWFMTHLQAPGLDVAGVALPGTPGVVVGHNERIAWGITNLHFDVQDLYIEKLDARNGRYLYRGQWEQARAEREIIRVKGQRPVELVVWVTRHGPVFLNEGNQFMALRWTVSEPGIVQYPILDIDRAGNWQEFTQALERFPGPGSNFVYADVDGNIGYHAAGKLPKRRGYRGDVPVDGATGDFDWDGYIPFGELPSVYNPPSGIVASANQDPFPPDYRYPVNGNFGPPYRARQIRDRLAARERWRAADLLGVQMDIYSAFSKFLAEQLVAAYDARHVRNPGLEDAVALLRQWNGRMEADKPAPLIAALAFPHVRTSIAEAAAPGGGRLYETKMSSAMVEKLLRERPEGWFRDYNEMLLRVLVDAVEEGKNLYGQDVKRWRYGASLRLGINNPVFHRVPAIGKYFDIAPVPMSGSGTTVKQSTPVLGPSMRMNADLGDWDASLLNIVTGQSGQILSRHYRDQWEDYLAGRSYPMQFGNVKAASTLEFRPARR
jgi:penicillin amidase